MLSGLDNNCYGAPERGDMDNDQRRQHKMDSNTESEVSR